MKVRSFDLDRPAPERDPGLRRRLDPEAMLERDAEVARLRSQKESSTSCATVEQPSRLGRPEGDGQVRA